MMDIDADYSALLAYTRNSSQLSRGSSSGRKSLASAKMIPKRNHLQVNRAVDDGSPSSVDIEMTDSPEDDSSAAECSSIDIDMTDVFTQEAAESVPEDLERRRKIPKSHHDPNDMVLDLFHVPAAQAITQIEQAKTPAPSTFEAEVVGLLDKDRIHSISFKDGRLKIRFQETTALAAV